MHILFYDVATPTTYTDLTLKQTGLGGTEATIVRVAHGLAAQHTVYVAQHCRGQTEEVMQNGVHYISLRSADQLKPDVVILLREKDYLEKVGQQFPQAKLYFWLHNMPSATFYTLRKHLIRYHYTIIAVSHFHAKAVQKRLAGAWYKRLWRSTFVDPQIPIEVIYNPIENNLMPDQSTYDSTQLIVTSSPYKALNLTLEKFEYISNFFPEYKLLIATYALWTPQKLPKQTFFLGSLSHTELMHYVRRSFCVFYPQHERCETFGLVYAEANAVGTPVLAHDFGAAKEVLTDPEKQLVNGQDKNAVLEKISNWRINRPKVCANPMFRLNKILADWENLLRKN